VDFDHEEEEKEEEGVIFTDKTYPSLLFIQKAYNNILKSSYKTL
jgi:uncharacterized iron-regulated protein